MQRSDYVNPSTFVVVDVVVVTVGSEGVFGESEWIGKKSRQGRTVGGRRWS